MRIGSSSGASAESPAEFVPPAWLDRIWSGVSEINEELIKRQMCRDLGDNRTKLEEKKTLIDHLLDRVEDANKPDLLADVLHHLGVSALIEYTYRRVDEKLEAIPPLSLRTLMFYKAGDLSRSAIASLHRTKREDAFYRALESRLAGLQDVRVKTILAAGDDQKKLAKLKRHLQDRNFIRPTRQNRHDIQKIFNSFKTDAARVKAYKYFGVQIERQLEKLGKSPVTLQQRKTYLSHIAALATTVNSLEWNAPGAITIATLYGLCSNSPAREGRYFKAEDSDAPVEALAAHLPEMATKVRKQFLHHVNFQLHELKFLDPSFQAVREKQVNKMIAATVLGAPDGDGSYPRPAQTNYARIHDKKTRQDMVKLVYQNRHLLTPENKAAMMDVFRQYSHEVAPGAVSGRWTALRFLTRDGRTLDRMEKIG